MPDSVIKDYLMSNLGFVLLIAGVVGDLLIPFVLAPFSGKYNHLTMVMSLLGNPERPLHLIYNIWLILAGLMFILGSIKLYVTYSIISKTLSICLLVTILVYAVGACILSGIFSVGETKELITISEKIHGYGSVLGFLLLVFVPLILALLSFKSLDITMGIASLLFFILAVLFFVFFVMADKEQYAQTVISYEGLWQRLSLMCMYAPIFMVSCKKLSEHLYYIK